MGSSGDRLAGAVPARIVDRMGSWLAGRRLVVALVLGLVGVLAVAIARPLLTTPQASAGPSPGDTAASAPPVAGAPISASVVRNGIRLTLTLDHGRAVAGERLQARIEIQNVGFTPVSWTSGGCRILNGFAFVGPDVAQPPPGRDWEGTAHWAKWSATTGGIGPVGFADARAVDRGPPFMFGCTADLFVDDIAPGQTLTADAVWPGRSSDGQPAPGGAYRLMYVFPYLAPVAKEQFRADPNALKQPISVELAVRIDPVPAVVVPSTIAVDAALGDPRVARWIAGVTREQLNGASVGLVDGLWQVSIRASTGSITVSVDPTTGVVRQVVLGPGS